MKQLLRNLALVALLCVPWVTQAQSVFSEDFEGGSMPTGWTTDGPGTWSVGTGDYSTGTGSHGGTYNALIKHSSNDNATKLITPEIDLSGSHEELSAEMALLEEKRKSIDELKAIIANRLKEIEEEKQRKEAGKPAPKKLSRKELIDKFITENPSISRPKAEFYNPLREHRERNFGKNIRATKLF